jgi:hypothetical protein
MRIRAASQTNRVPTLAFRALRLVGLTELSPPVVHSCTSQERELVGRFQRDRPPWAPYAYALASGAYTPVEYRSVSWLEGSNADAPYRAYQNNLYAKSPG